jgi:hypothetical protein
VNNVLIQKLLATPEAFEILSYDSGGEVPLRFAHGEVAA